MNKNEYEELNITHRPVISEDLGFQQQLIHESDFMRQSVCRSWDSVPAIWLYYGIYRSFAIEAP